MRNKTLITCILCAAFCTLSCHLSAQQTYAFVERDTTLHLDFYPAQSPNGYTVIHIFGGGFIGGYRANKFDADYCRQLADSGYNAVAIDYRLGLKGVNNVGVTNIAPLENAIYMAVEDCSDAIRYLVENALKLGIDPKKIIIEGSSAGAITALMTDYARCNALTCASPLPQDWSPAAIVAYSGAIFSRQGKPKWGEKTFVRDSAVVVQGDAAPTLMFHGTADKLVPYKKVQLGKLGFFGSSAIASQMEKLNLPYQIYRYTDLGHEVAIGGPLTMDVFNLFVKQYIILGKKQYQDITIRDEQYPPTSWSRV